MGAIKTAVLFLPSGIAATLAAWQIQRMQQKVSGAELHVRVDVGTHLQKQ
jgi:hypothetical protein